MISKVCRRDVGSESEAFDASVLEPQRAAAKLLDVIHAVGTEQQSSTVLQELLDPGDALALERLIADSKNFVGNQNFRLHGRRYGESQAHDHA